MQELLYDFLEPVKLIGLGEYNLDALTHIEVTESYLGLDQEVRECQNKEALFNCTTRFYLDEILQKCGCLPLNIKLSTQKVHFSLEVFECVRLIDHILGRNVETD